jgi:tRNA-dihydrouridine synthase 3
LFILIVSDMGEAGICKIKSEFVLPEQSRQLALECVSEKDKLKLTKDENGAPPEKKQKLSKSQKKKLRGQNKSRGPTFRCSRETELCNTLVDLGVDDEIPKCERKNCQFLHDIEEYLKIKPQDIGETCYNYETFGKCSRGLACRFGSSHITPEGRNKVNLEKSVERSQTKNQLTHDLQISLRKRTYNFDFAESLIKYNDKQNKKVLFVCGNFQIFVKIRFRQMQKQAGLLQTRT